MRILIAIILSALCLLFNSCDNSFNPYGEYKESYVLTCMLRADSLGQIATITKNYPENSSEYTGLNNWITGAEVTVWQGDAVYVFKDSTGIINDPVLGPKEISFYYHPDLKLLPDQPLEIEALLDFGKRLKATSTSPKSLIFTNVASSTVIPPVGNDNFVVAWSTAGPGDFYVARLMIRYLKKIDGVDTKFTYTVPVEYVMQNGNEVPVYATPHRNTSESFKFTAITRAMELISDGEENKALFTIYQNPIIEAIAMDENLSRYYSVGSDSFDDLTVRVNSTDFTNIDGGFGVFGSYIINNQTITKILPEYIQSFGYNVKFGN